MAKAQLLNLNPYNGFLFACVQREMNKISPLLYFLLSAAGAFRKNVTKPFIGFVWFPCLP